MSIMSRTLTFTLAAGIALLLSINVARAQEGGAAAPAPPPINELPPQPAPPGQSGQPPTTAPEQKGPTLDEMALAERFAEMAQSVLANPNRAITEVSWKESAALLQAAARLNPLDPRYFRLLAEAELQNRNPDGALDALKQYTAQLAIQMRDVDQGAMLRIIDLNAAKMESADEKLGYYKQLLDASGSIADEVRSYVAVRAAKLYLDRSQDTEAQQMVEQALRLNGLNFEALRLNLQRIERDPAATPVERVRALYRLIMSNPEQPAVMTRIATEMAEAGLYKESHWWYTTAMETAVREGGGIDRAAVLEDAFIAYMIDDLRGAEMPASQILQLEPFNPVARFLNLLVARRRGPDAKEQIDRAREDTLTALLEQVYNAHRELTGGKDPAATQPTGDLPKRLGDITADVKQINDTHNDAARARYALALEDLAWFELYYEEKPDAAGPIIDAMRQLLGDDAPAVAKLQGWQFLRSNKLDEARVKLSAVADKDPLAAMGMVLLTAKSGDPPAAETAKSEARRLISQNPSGLVGATLLDGLRDLGAQFVPTTKTDAVRQAAEQFPKAWLAILDKPQQFYRIRAEPTRVSYGYNEPIFARVTISNINQQGAELTMGPEGVIKPDLWFDVKFSGGVNNVTIPGAAFDRITKALVLRPGQSVSQFVRLDQHMVAEGLAQRPVASIQMFWSVFTNPAPAPGGAAPGPAGQRQSMTRVIERAAAPMFSDAQLKAVLDRLNGAPADVRLQTLDLLGVYVRIYAANDQLKPKIGDLMAAIDHTMRDADNPPGVRLWAAYIAGALKPQPEQRVSAIQQIGKQDWWPAQMLALASAIGMQDAGRAIAEPLKNSPDPTVKRMAEAVSYDLAHPTTQPTTAPSATTQPAGAATPPLSPSLSTPTSGADTGANAGTGATSATGTGGAGGATAGSRPSQPK